jgi:hypothetical protein
MALAALFCWVFTLRPVKALTVGMLAAGVTVGIETLL